MHYVVNIYNAKALVNKYLVGDLVWILNEQSPEGECHKLQPAYIGPCVVTKVFSDLVFEIRLDARDQHKVVNHNKLLPYRGDSPPRWALRLSQKLKNRCVT